MLLFDNEAGKKELLRCTLPGCLANRIIVAQNVPSAWGDISSAVSGGLGYVYYANADSTIRKNIDDGSANSADTDSSVVWTGTGTASVTRFDGTVYWLDGSRNVWSLNPADDTTSQTGVTLPGTEAVSCEVDAPVAAALYSAP